MLLLLEESKYWRQSSEFFSWTSFTHRSAFSGEQLGCRHGDSISRATNSVMLRFSRICISSATSCAANRIHAESCGSHFGFWRFVSCSSRWIMTLWTIRFFAHWRFLTSYQFITEYLLNCQRGQALLTQNSTFTNRPCMIQKNHLRPRRFHMQ